MSLRTEIAGKKQGMDNPVLIIQITSVTAWDAYIHGEHKWSRYTHDISHFGDPIPLLRALLLMGGDLPDEVYEKV